MKESTVGSCTIDVRVGGSGENTREGFLVVSERQQHPETFFLAVWILLSSSSSDSSQTSTLFCWQGSVAWSELKFLQFKSNSKSNLHNDELKQRITSVLASKLSHEEQVETHWTLEEPPWSFSSSATTSELAVSIVDQRTGLKVVRWKGSLKKQESASACYTALQTLHTEIATRKESFSKLCADYEKERNMLRQAADEYKKTVDSLEGEWESEKTQLLKNFLKVYNGRADLLRKQTQEIKDLKEQLEKAQTAAASSSSKQTKGAGRLKQPDFLQDVPQDDIEIEGDTVDRLAGGERVTTQPPPAHRPTSTASRGRDPRVRRNPITGVTEYHDAEAALEDTFGNHGIKGEKSNTSVAVVKKEPKSSSVQPDFDTSHNDKQTPVDSDTTNQAAASSTKVIKTESASDNEQTEKKASQPAKIRKRRQRDSSSSSSSSDIDKARPKVHRKIQTPVSTAFKTETSSPTEKAVASRNNQRRSRRTRRRRSGSGSSSDTDSDKESRKKSRSTTAKRPSRKKSTIRHSDSSSSSESNGPVQTRKNLEPTINPAAAADSATEDEDAVDESMRNSIMSQLALLKKQEEAEQEQAD